MNVPWIGIGRVPVRIRRGSLIPAYPVIDALSPDILDEGTAENAVRLRTAGQAGQWHPTSINRTRYN